MADLDPNIPLGIRTAPQAQANPIETMLGLTALQQRQNQIAQFQQGFTAREALGEIMPQATGPDGTVDWDKVVGLAAQDPRTAWLAQDIANNAAIRKQTQAQTAKTNLEADLSRIATINQHLGALADKGANVTPDDVLDVSGNLVASGVMTAKQIAGYLKDMPSQGGAPLQDWVRQHQQNGLSTEQQLKMAHEKLQVAAGNRVQILNNNQITGQVSDAGSVPIGGAPMSASEAATPVTAPAGPQGQPQEMLKGSTGATGAPAAGFTPAGGAPAKGAAAGPATAAGPASGPSGGLVTGGGKGSAFATGLSPEAEETSKKLGQGSGDYINDLNSTVMDIVPMMQRMKAERDALANTEVGGGMEFRASAAQALQALQKAGIPVPKSWIDGVAGGSIADAQTLKALMVTQAIEQMKLSVQGSGRAMRPEVDAFINSYPNLNSDPDAFEKILNFMSGVAGKYVEQQQAVPEFKKAVTASGGALQMSDFPAWFTKRQLDNGTLNFAPSTGKAKGSTQAVTKQWVRGPNGGLVLAPAGGQ